MFRLQLTVVAQAILEKTSFEFQLNTNKPYSLLYSERLNSSPFRELRYDKDSVFLICYAND